MYTILIVEDDKSLSNGIALALRDPELTFVQAFDIQNAAELYKTQNIALVILDLNLPDGSGLDFLRSVRQSSVTPVLILTANDLEMDIVTGLESGADDYITKPFSVMELQARVKAFLRRTTIYHAKAEHHDSRIAIGDLTIETEDLVVKKRGVPVSLTAKEFEILKLFAKHPEKVYTKVSIYQEVWDEEFLHDDNVINVTIRRLREKIEDQPSDPRYIKTVWGIGYKLGTPVEGGK